ncbi:MAG: hypothetical protein KF745_12045 [Phycisphaeraceae bacterium]|nr:hypothetical protein [Phycisphaeraceae bacterium]
MKPLHPLILVTVIAACCGAALSAPPPKPESPPAKKNEPKKQPPTPGGEVPSLDDLLGTGDQKPKGDGPPPAVDPSASDLTKKLDAKELGDAFKEAVAMMGEVAGRLQDSKDPGVGTQRIQEGIVRRLDTLIAQIEQQQSQGSSRSRQNTSKEDQGQSQRQQSSTRREQAGTGDNNSEMEPPPRQEGPLAPEIDSARAAWGALPERVRQMLLQGSSDKFSSMYQRMTEAYYRKLAEEGKK